MLTLSPRQATGRGLLLLSILCGAAYFLTASWRPFTGSVLLKGASIAALAVLAFLAGFKLLGLALTFSSAGDVLLDLDPDRLFVSGLLCFLAAHLVYIVLFLRSRRRPWNPAAWRIIAATLVVLYAAAFSIWLAPSLGSLSVPVFVYIGAITGMVVTATLAGLPRPWVLTGAILFLVSDSLLAVARFKGFVPFRDYLVWATYYLGQYSIAAGFYSCRNAASGSTLVARRAGT